MGRDFDLNNGGVVEVGRALDLDTEGRVRLAVAMTLTLTMVEG